MIHKSFSSIVLSVTGVLLSGMGLYFIFFRPPLLPEDLLYMSITMQNVEGHLPGLLPWLQKVFWVLGGYVFTTGVLTVYISLTSFRTRLTGSLTIIYVTGISSIGLMTIVNFMINSNFKWILLGFAFLWVIALLLHQLNK